MPVSDNHNSGKPINSVVNIWRWILTGERLLWAWQRLSQFRIEVIADTAFGQDKVIAQFFAQVMNMHFDGVTFDILLPTIDLVFEASATAYLFWVGDVLEYRDFFNGQIDRLSVIADLLSLW